jgi:enoyl-CoA hydratase/carnithine racemase
MIEVKHQGRVAVLTIRRPQRRNALGSDIVAMLSSALDAASADDNIGAIVLTGEAPSFCAGSDLKELGQMDVAGMVDHELETGRIARRIGLLDIPVIAAVEGHALGGGFILAASCDLVVSAETAKWSLPEVPNGWLPPWGLKALAVRVGSATARRLVWGYEVLDGNMALQLGVADYVVPEGMALQEAINYATRIAELPRNALTSTKLYFQSEMLRDAELWDERSARAFADDCRHPAAAVTLRRFAR